MAAERSPPFLAAIDLASYEGIEQIQESKELAYAGGLVTTVTSSNIDKAFALLKTIAH